MLGHRGRAEELIRDFEARLTRLKEQFNPYADRTIAVISVNEMHVRVDSPDKAFPGPILTGPRTGPRAGGDLNPISAQICLSMEHVPALQVVDGLLIRPWSSDAEAGEFTAPSRAPC